MKFIRLVLAATVISISDAVQGRLPGTFTSEKHISAALQPSKVDSQDGQRSGSPWLSPASSRIGNAGSNIDDILTADDEDGIHGWLSDHSFIDPKSLSRDLATRRPRLRSRSNSGALSTARCVTSVVTTLASAALPSKKVMAIRSAIRKLGGIWEWVKGLFRTVKHFMVKVRREAKHARNKKADKALQRELEEEALLAGKGFMAAVKRYKNTAVTRIGAAMTAVEFGSLSHCFRRGDLTYYYMYAA